MNLFSIPIVATAIAIIISWALFAIFCSLLQEAVAQLKAERGRFMKQYLFSQLKDNPNGINWASLLYMHGAIDLLSRTANKPTNDISPRLFAQTLIEVVGNAQLVQMQIPALQKQQAAAGTSVYQQPTLYNFHAATQVLKPSDMVSFFNQAITAATIKAGKDAAGALNESDVYKNLQEHIENWYTEFSERLTLWYKKKTRQRLFMLGALLALIVNVDSIQLFSFYNDNADARNSVISYYQKNGDALSKLASSLNDSNKIKQPATDSLLKQAKVFYNSVDSLKKMANLPIGYQYSILSKWKPVLKNWDKDSWAKALWKLLGILMSGFAASVGAPFWFDILKKAYSSKP